MFRHPHILALVCGLSPRIKLKRTIVVLKAFIDDSGSGPDGKVFVLAGFISTAECWDEFSVQWDSICAKEPATPDFHMVEAWRLKGGYWGRGSTDELTARRDKKLSKLAASVRDNVICSITTGLTWRAYESAVQGNVPPTVDNPYFFLFWNIIQLVVKWERASSRREKVDFVFDDQSKIGREAQSWHCTFLDCMNDDEKFILSGTPIFKHDSDTPPLKAADMWAWHYRREVMEREQQGALYRRTEAGEILWQPTYVATNMVENDLRALVARLTGK